MGNETINNVILSIFGESKPLLATWTADNKSAG